MREEQQIPRDVDSPYALPDLEQQFLDALEEVFLREEFADVAGNFQIGHKFEQTLNAQPMGGELILDVDCDGGNPAQWVMHRVIPIPDRTRALSFLCIYCKQGNPPRVVCCSKLYKAQ